MTMKRESASYAVKNTSATSIPKAEHARKSAAGNCGTYVKIKRIRKCGRAPVYNMEVRNHHNYAVNGGFILHNCDALRYFVNTIIRSRRLANA